MPRGSTHRGIIKINKLCSVLLFPEKAYFLPNFTLKVEPTFLDFNFKHHLSQENPNYSFLLPFAQYNLQCPGYYLPVLQGKWVYPHSNRTCRIWNKIISYSAITRDPHRGGWVVGRAGGRQVAFFWCSGKRRCIFFHRSCW